MEEAYAFMQRLLAYPVAECAEPMVSIRDAAHETGVRVDLPAGLKLGALQRVFHLRRSVVERLLHASESMLRRGWLLRVEDAYRSLAVQAQGTVCDFIVDTMWERTTWELGGVTPPLDLLLRRLAVMTATTPKFANHMSGSAFDMSVLDAATGQEINRGGSYLHVSERTPMDSPFISPEARRNRAEINAVLAGHGFLPYPYEFWHYSHGDIDCEVLAGTGRPARYGPVNLDVETGAVEPVRDPCANLLDEGKLRRRLRSSRRSALSGPTVCP